VFLRSLKTLIDNLTTLRS